MASRRIAVLLNRNRCAYSYALGDALEAAAAAQDVELELWPVPWATSSQEVQEADLQDLVDQGRRVAGLIMISSVFSHGIKSLSKFTQLWWPRPSSSIGYRLPLIPSVLVDNRSAMHAATLHLAQEHGRKDFLYIQGRHDSQEAKDRYFGFRQALSECHIISDTTRVLPGDFTRASAVNAIQSLPAGTKFNALIAANDEMALAAMTELERRGTRIPSDVAIIGFDDIPASARSVTTLTTMAQPYAALARKAIELVTDQCEGRSVRTTSMVAANFVPRMSCGCVAPKLRSTTVPSGDF
jgi:DNA-binding LacI/PurR family transcriptional regulator